MTNCASFEKLLARPCLVADIDREIARRHLREFIAQAWSVVEPATEFVPGWHLDAITEHLEAVTRGQIRNLLINMPPRHMKSLAVAVFWPVWEWIDHPERRWLFSSYALSLSIRDSVKCRRLVQSVWFQSHWGDRFSFTGDQNAKERFENDRSGYRLATSVGGAATGEGGDRIVVDDPHNVKEAESDTVRQAAIAWWDEVMSTRLNDPKTGAKVVVMQRVHQQDLAGHLLEQGGYEHLCLPAEYEGDRRATSIGWSDPRSEAGDLLWPARFGREELETLKRALGSYASASQLQQRPSPASGGIFKRYWWRFWQPRDVSLPPVCLKLPDGTVANVTTMTLPESFDVQIQSWDLAFKDTASSAYVAGQVWARKGADRFLLDQVRDKWDFVSTLNAMRALTAKWPNAGIKLVEDRANGPALISTLRREISGLVAVEPDGSKEARAFAVTPEIESGNVFLPHPSLAAWVGDLIEEASLFPRLVVAQEQNLLLNFGA